MDNVKEKVCEIIKEHYLDELDLNESFDALGINSVTFVRITVSIENEYEFEFAEEDFDEGRFESVNDFIEYIEKRIKDQ